MRINPRYSELIQSEKYSKVFELFEEETTQQLIYLLRGNRIFGNITRERSKRFLNTAVPGFFKNFW